MSRLLPSLGTRTGAERLQYRGVSCPLQTSLAATEVNKWLSDLVLIRGKRGILYFQMLYAKKNSAEYSMFQIEHLIIEEQFKILAQLIAGLSANDKALIQKRYLERGNPLSDEEKKKVKTINQWIHKILIQWRKDNTLVLLESPTGRPLFFFRTR